MGGGGAVALALADDDGKKRGGMIGRVGERGGRARGLLYQVLCRGIQGHFGGKKRFLTQNCPENPPRFSLPQDWGKFGAVGVLPYDLIPRAIPQISPQYLSLSPL